MSTEVIGVCALLGYLGALFVVAEIARRARRDSTPADHFLAARDLGTLVLFLTLYSTAYSGNSLLGYPGNAYRTGYSFIMATGFMMSIVVVYHALVPKLRPLATAHGFVTPGDWIRHRFGESGAARWLLWVVAVLMSIALANFLLAQLKAMGHVTDRMTGGMVPYELGVVGLAAIVLFYETLGGMRAVAWTDAAQGLLMLVGLAALLGWLLVEAGGLDAVTRAVAHTRPEAVAVPSAAVRANWASSILLLGLASVIYPQAIQRIYAARSGAVLRRSLALMSFMPLTTTLVVTLIGIAAITRVEVGSAVAADEVMPILLGEWASGDGLHPVAAVAVFIGALAAIMSTADSCLLSLGSLVARDLAGRSDVAAATTRLGKRVAAVLLVAMIPLALSREVTLWRLIELKMELLIQCVPAFLVALHWRGLSARGALAGVLAGTALALGLTFGGATRVGGVHAGVVGLGLNLAVALLVSFVGRRQADWTSDPAEPGGVATPSASAR
ncbi:MAG: sodium:solute symporter family protein [Myxococcota bacterium]